MDFLCAGVYVYQGGQRVGLLSDFVLRKVSDLLILMLIR